MLDLDRRQDRALIERSPVLPDDAASFAGRRDAGERMLRRRAARLLLGALSGARQAEVVITNDPLGAPMVEAPAGWSLSLAARWPRFVVAVGRHRIGVDLELAGAPLPDDLLTARERDHLATLAYAERPFAGAAIWAAKEAYAKWTSRPRAINPAAVETSEAGVVRSDVGRTFCWRCSIDGAAVALCATAA